LPNRRIYSIGEVLRPGAIWVKAIKDLDPSAGYVGGSRTADRLG